ncbi:MAG: general secretion pathway protein GspE [Bacteroidetes bacterium GWF2_33_16]|nr:MAG: general secretion pathway protein GspE [Bacteroidetes bacterium GWE2_32_14]OFY06660.1 MAG: general secretion pathway protein GspE [Bacteroidetes bacterium GWF2_33_16]
MTPPLNIPIDIRQLITSEQAWHYSIIPSKLTSTTFEFFIDENNYSDNVVEELEVLFEKRVTLTKYSSEVINKALSIYYRRGDAKHAKSKWINNKISDDFLEKIIIEAHSINSSDIHIESFEDSGRIRMRNDGKLIERYHLKKEDYPSLINKIKIKANLDIAEKRLPQDGRIYFVSQSGKFDIRVSVLPTLHGEKVVLRLLSKDATSIDINDLGFQPKQLEDYLEGIKKPHGIILISGPTGSGKTTTLYATLKILNKEETNILTIEDPIEYTLEGINQVQLKENIGLSFAKALRTFLRQDPDIIMLGEIRDNETAQMAVRAALTGHLVLSTIHTNSAWGTISRLIDMGVPPFLLSSTINLTVAQRLIRLVCPHCCTEEKLNLSLFPKNFSTHRNITVHKIAKGCPECYYTGYKGRKAVYEVIPVDSEFAAKIKSNQFDISESLKQKQIRTMADSALDLLMNGKTTIEEIYSILMHATND